MPPDQIYVRIGALIRARRKTLDLNQEDLASMLGISRGSLANIETGRQSVLVHQLYKFAVKLKLKPSDLLPSPSIDRPGAERTELPLPDGLKAQQRKQVTHFFLQEEVGQQFENEGSHAKATKH